MKIKELYTDESKWIKGLFAAYYGEHGLLKDSPVHDSKSTCWCLYGAIQKCYDSLETVTVLRKICKKLSCSSSEYIFHWNDHHARTFEEVKQLVEELDI